MAEKGRELRFRKTLAVKIGHKALFALTIWRCLRTIRSSLSIGPDESRHCIGLGTLL
jgi:hypothetical protein